MLELLLDPAERPPISRHHPDQLPAHVALRIEALQLPLLVELYGPDRALEVAAAAHASVDGIRAFCDDHRVDAARRGRAAIHVLDHRPAGDVGQRLAGKARGVVTGRDDGDSSGRL